MIDFVELKLYLCTNKINVYIKNKTIIVFCVLFLKTKVLCNDKTKIQRFFNPEE